MSTEARIWIAESRPERVGAHCLVEGYRHDDDHIVRVTFADGHRVLASIDATREYTIADDNRRQSEHYRTHPRVDAVD